MCLVWGVLSVPDISVYLFHGQKKEQIHVQIGGGIRVPHILSTFFTIKKKYELHGGVRVPDIFNYLFTVKKSKK